MIPLTQNQFAKVDDGDYELVVKYRWRAVKQLRKLGPIRWYAMATIDGKSVMMHRLILGVTDDLQVDHEDNNGLNNIRLNMRVCTKAQNQHNKRPQAGTSRPVESGYVPLRKCRPPMRLGWY